MTQIDTRSPEYKTGQKLGAELAEGYSVRAAEELSQYTQQLAADSKSPAALLKKQANLYAGMQEADPTDVKLNMQGNKGTVSIDWYSELYVNSAFGTMDRFSNSPRLDHSKDPVATPEAAIQIVNQNIATVLKPQDRGNFVDDFNRRRLENNYLPNFEAYQDNSDGQVKIRQLEAPSQ
jgi:hypothetical protein